MSLFKKIFGSAKTAGDAEQARAQERRAPRVSLTPLHRISFLEKSGTTSQLANISSSGMALLRGGTAWLPGETHSGRLTIDRDEHAIELRVRHASRLASESQGNRQSSQLVGCEFVGSENPALRRSIEIYLRVEILALTLRLVNEAYLTPDPRGQTLWYTDGRQNELFVIVDDKGVAAYHMSFLGNYVEGSRGQVPRVGELRESSGSGPNGQKGATLIELGGQPVGHMLNLALSFVRNVDQLAPPIRAELAASLANHQSG